MITKIMSFYSATILLAIGLILGACRSKSALSDRGVPYTLQVAVYAGDNPGETKQVLAKLAKYLEKELGLKVEFTMCSDYTSVIEAIQTRKVHAASLSPFSYVIAAQREGLSPLVGLGLWGKPFLYRSLIITNRSSGLKNMGDVKARAKGLTLCFADPASTSGHLVPRSYFLSMGLDPDTAFKETMFAGSHAASVMTVLSGKVDIGCTFEYAINMLTARGRIKKDDIVVLWESDPIVEGCIVIRNDIDTAFANKLKVAYLQLSTKRPDIMKAYGALYNLPDGLGYLPAQDSSYNTLRKIASGVRDLDLLIKKQTVAAK